MVALLPGFILGLPSFQRTECNRLEQGRQEGKAGSFVPVFDCDLVAAAWTPTRMNSVSNHLFFFWSRSMAFSFRSEDPQEDEDEVPRASTTGGGLRGARYEFVLQDGYQLVPR